MGCGGCRQDLNAQQTFSLRIRERPAQAPDVLCRTPGKNPLEPGQMPMKPTSMAAAATPPLTKPRAADVAYDAIEVLFSTLQLAPGSPVVETELVQQTGLGRTPVREALLRMTASGLIVQQPRRGLLVSHNDLGEYLDVIQTRRVLETLIAACT